MKLFRRFFWAGGMIGTLICIYDVWQSGMETGSAVCTTAWLIVGIFHLLEGTLEARPIIPGQETSS